MSDLQDLMRSVPDHLNFGHYAHITNDDVWKHGVKVMTETPIFANHVSYNPTSRTLTISTLDNRTLNYERNRDIQTRPVHFQLATVCVQFIVYVAWAYMIDSTAGEDFYKERLAYVDAVMSMALPTMNQAMPPPPPQAPPQAPPPGAHQTSAIYDIVQPLASHNTYVDTYLDVNTRYTNQQLATFRRDIMTNWYYARMNGDPIQDRLNVIFTTENPRTLDSFASVIDEIDHYGANSSTEQRKKVNLTLHNLAILLKGANPYRVPPSRLRQADTNVSVMIKLRLDTGTGLIKRHNTDRDLQELSVNADRTRCLMLYNDVSYLFGPFDKVSVREENDADEMADRLIKMYNLNTTEGTNEVIGLFGYGASGAGKSSYLVGRMDDEGTKTSGVIVSLVNKLVQKHGVKVSIDFFDHDYTTNNISQGAPTPVKKTIEDNAPTGELGDPYTYEFFSRYMLDYYVMGEDGKETSAVLLNGRLTRATTNNPKSSRSHSIAKITAGSTVIIFGDLAGFENKFDCRNSITSWRRPDISKEYMMDIEKGFKLRFDKFEVGQSIPVKFPTVLSTEKKLGNGLQTKYHRLSHASYSSHIKLTDEQYATFMNLVEKAWVSTTEFNATTASIAYGDAIAKQKRALDRIDVHLAGCAARQTVRGGANTSRGGGDVKSVCDQLQGVTSISVHGYGIADTLQAAIDAIIACNKIDQSIDVRVLTDPIKDAVKITNLVGTGNNTDYKIKYADNSVQNVKSPIKANQAEALFRKIRPLISNMNVRVGQVDPFMYELSKLGLKFDDIASQNAINALAYEMYWAKTAEAYETEMLTNFCHERNKEGDFIRDSLTNLRAYIRSLTPDKLPVIPEDCIGSSIHSLIRTDGQVNVKEVYPFGKQDIPTKICLIGVVDANNAKRWPQKYVDITALYTALETQTTVSAGGEALKVAFFTWISSCLVGGREGITEDTHLNCLNVLVSQTPATLSPTDRVDLNAFFAASYPGKTEPIDGNDLMSECRKVAMIEPRVIDLPAFNLAYRGFYEARNCADTAGVCSLIKKMNAAKLVKALITEIANLNQGTPVGVLEYLDSMAKFGRTDRICRVDNNILTTNFEDGANALLFDNDSE
jgi:hypothetical protein